MTQDFSFPGAEFQSSDWEPRPLGEIMSAPVVAVAPGDGLHEVAALMAERGISCVVVVVDSRPVGILTERDLVRIALREPAGERLRVGDCMSVAPVTAATATDYREAYQLLSERGIRHLIVVDEAGAVAGIVTESDIVAELGFEYFLALRNVGAIMARSVATASPADPVSRALAIMVERCISCVVVAEGGRAVGVVTERDVTRLYHRGVDVEATALAEVMGRPLVAVGVETPVQQAVALMREAGIRRVVVEENGRVAGLVTEHDVVKGLRAHYVEFLRQVIRDQAWMLRETNRQLDEKLVLDNLLRHSLDGVIVATDLDWRVCYHNRFPPSLGEAGDLVGSAVAETPVGRFLSGEVLARGVAAVENGGDYSFPLELEGHHWACRLGGLRGDAPGHLGYVLSARDVTPHRRSELALRDSEAQVRLLLDSTGEGIFAIDTLGRCVLANPACARILGYGGVEDFTGRDMHSLIHHHHRDGRVHSVQACPVHEVARSGQPMHVAEDLFWTAAGQPLPVEYFAQPMRRQGELVGAVVSFFDISRRKQAEERLRLTATVFDNAREGIVIADRDNRIIMVNQAFSQLTGYAPEEVYGQSTAILRSGRQDGEFYERMWGALLDKGQWSGEIWNRRKDGSVFPEWLEIVVARDGHGEPSHYVAVFSDISSLKESEERFEFLAHHDDLTELPNRLLLNKRLKEALDEARVDGGRVAVLFMDLNRFKDINDSLGHSVGDQVLQLVAARMTQGAAAELTIARLGGDELVFLLPGVREVEEASALADRLLGAFARPFVALDDKMAAHEIYLGASIGISLFPDDAEDPPTLVQHADAAMYQAKKRGRNSYQFYTDDLSVSAHRRRSVEHGLRRAVEDDNSFLLLYQPKIELKSRRIVGMEALVRWRRDDGSTVSPGEFIALAEDSGLIIPMGEWILNRACRDTAVLNRLTGSSLKVAVNLSARQFRQQGLVKLVARILAESGLAPELLELELTESMLVEEVDEAAMILRQLRGIGITLALDDFGTGYSSLAYLARFPIDVLKIDQSFVRALKDGGDGAAIVAAIADMGHRLGLSVVAEGIETLAQLSLLRKLDCDVGQGYLISRPVGLDELRALVLQEEIKLG